MKKLLLTIITAFTVIVAYSQQPTDIVVQPSHITVYGDDIITSDFEYNEDGTIASYYSHAHVTEPGDMRDDTVYMQYNDRNNLTILDWRNYYSPASAFWYQHRSQHTYDDENRLVEVMTTDLGWLNRPLAQWVPEYDEEGRVVSDSYYCWYYLLNGSPVVYLQQQRNTTYSDTQNVTVIERWDKDGTAKKFRITKNFTSDGKTQSVMWECFSYTAGTYVNVILSNYIYLDGRLAEVEDDVWNGSSWVHKKKTIYTRDANGRIAMAEHKLWNSVLFTHYKRTLYERNELGYPTTMQFQDYSYDNNCWDEGSSMVDLAYYGDGYINYPIPNYDRYRLIDSVFTDNHLRFIDNHFVQSNQVSRLEFTYTETPNPHYAVDDVVTKSIAVYPNPANEVVKVTGKDIERIEVMNLSGQTVMKLDCGGDNVNVNISSLTSGIYMMKVRMADDSEFTERIVKQ